MIGKLRQVEVLTAQGKSIAEAVKTIAVTETTYFRWRQEYGGMKSDQVRRLKELEGIPPLNTAAEEYAITGYRLISSTTMTPSSIAAARPGINSSNNQAVSNP